MAILSDDTQWVPGERPGARAGRLPAIEPIRIGAYLHSARDLYRVEDLTEGAISPPYSEANRSQRAASRSHATIRPPACASLAAST